MRLINNRSMITQYPANVISITEPSSGKTGRTMLLIITENPLRIPHCYLPLLLFLPA